MKPIETFHELNIPFAIKESLKAMNFVTPTPVQARAIPAGLEGRDIVGTAQTGTGKTGAFGIPMLASLHAQTGKQALVLAPTRELAAQIFIVLRTMAKGSSLEGSLVVGGESFGRQRDELRRGVDYIVATPGRLNDHLMERTIRLNDVAILVLDEVDRMLDMGFLPQIKGILRHLPTDRQTMLFSATLPKEVTRFVDTLVREPVRVAVGDIARPTGLVTEKLVPVKQEHKSEHLLKELAVHQGKTLVFVRTKSRTQRVLRLLENKGMRAVCLHGGRSQSQRKYALERFRSGSHPILVATDLAGRGLDIVDVDQVVNFDVPMTREDYIHRLGRTGRAGRTGTATSFVQIGNRDEHQIVTGKKPEKGTRDAQTHFGRGANARLRSGPGHPHSERVADRRENRNFRERPRRARHQGQWVARSSGRAGVGR